MGRSTSGPLAPDDGSSRTPRADVTSARGNVPSQCRRLSSDLIRGERGGVWSQDIVGRCFGTSCTPRSREVGSVAGTAGGQGGRGARTAEGGGGQRLWGVPAVAPGARQAFPGGG